MFLIIKIQAIVKVPIIALCENANMDFSPIILNLLKIILRKNYNTKWIPAKTIPENILEKSFLVKNHKNKTKKNGPDPTTLLAFDFLYWHFSQMIGHPILPVFSSQHQLQSQTGIGA